MNTWVKRSLNAGVLTAGALLASGAAAHASPTMISTDNTGALNGTQAALPVQAPINLCGNAVAAAGTALAGCEGGSAAALNPEWRFDHYGAESGPTMVTAGNTGLGNGTQLYAPIQAPVNVCGNAIAVLGKAAAGCEGGADASNGKPGKHRDPGYGKPGYEQPGRDRDGHDHSGGKPSRGWDWDRDRDRDRGRDRGPGQDGGPGGYGYQEEAQAEHDAPAGQALRTSRGGADLVSSGNVGVLNGTQALVPVQVPIDVCGNAVGVLGTAAAECEGGASAVQW